MEKKNRVFIAKSLDGFIADKDGGIDWLNEHPNPEQDDMGYVEFMSSVDALLMGRNTFETVDSFDIEWPYQKHVFVLSTRLQRLPEKYENKVTLINGNIREVLDKIHALGYYKLYIDGGKIIQTFLEEDLIDELIISTIPIVLGNGIPLFGKLAQRLRFRLKKTEPLNENLVKSHYIRIRE